MGWRGHRGSGTVDVRERSGVGRIVREGRRRSVEAVRAGVNSAGMGEEDGACRGRTRDLRARSEVRIVAGVQWLYTK
jgi:hypothetical protein